MPDGVIRFSTLYSQKKNQLIKIENFHYSFKDKKWHYHLEYSTEYLELTNERWNSNEKLDNFGHPVKSRLSIENLQVNSLSGVIEFELSPD